MIDIRPAILQRKKRWATKKQHVHEMSGIPRKYLERTNDDVRPSSFSNLKGELVIIILGNL